MPTNKQRLAWHFAPADGKLAHTGEPIPADGVTLKLEGEITPCERGFHASERVIDAFGFVAGDSIITRVMLGGTVVEHGSPVDKLAASERTILWRLDFGTTDRILREFARWCALEVAHLWDMPPVVREYLETGSEELRDAAQAAAWDAAWDATRDAAWDATRDASWAATRAAARSASWGASWGAVWDAAWAAARSAARSAAWGAARGAQNDKLTSLILAAHAEAADAD